jgi:hypothetical protein
MLSKVSDIYLLLGIGTIQCPFFKFNFMAHHETQEENLSHEEIMYRYHILRGSDFTKIDLFLSARNNYERALKYHPADPFATERITACTEQIRQDRKKVLVIAPIVLAVIAIVTLLNI